MSSSVRTASSTGSDDDSTYFHIDEAAQDPTSSVGSVISGGGDGDGEIKVLIQAMDDENVDRRYDDEDTTNFITPNIQRSLSMALSEMNLNVEIDSDEQQTEAKADTGGTAKNDVVAPATISIRSIHPTPPSSLLSRELCYGHKLSPDEAAKYVPPGDGGLHRYALLINGDPFDEKTGKLMKGLNPRDFDMETKMIKPHRANLPILAEDFYSSLTRVQEVDEDGNPMSPRYIFHGILNGWPSLQRLEVIRIQRRREKESWHPSALFAGTRVWTHMWSASNEGAKGEGPIITEEGSLFRITFRGPSWTARGWSPMSPGFSYWYCPQIKLKDGTGLFVYGTDMVKFMAQSEEASSCRCTHVHMIAHRYARLRESPKDKLTYHSVVFLEWDHGKYGTILEAAYLNGLGGFRGKSNWFHDLDAPMTELYRSFPPELVSPWSTNSAEIRAFDCPHIKSIQDFRAYIHKYTGPDQRFLDPHFYFTAPARLTHRSKAHISNYINNYIRRDVSYNQLTRNCQTFCADFCAFLAGKKEVLPYHPVNRIEYRNRTHLFLYEPDAYDSSKPKSSQEQRKSSFLL
jgi:hypothetical protein